MKKYLVAYKISWSHELEYRFNFFMGRLRNVIVLLLLYYVWKSLTYKTGMFAGYSEIELITYVFLVNILRSVIFGVQTRNIASQINQGELSKFLTMPINYFWYNFFLELAQRSIHLLSAIFEVILFALILKVNFFWQFNWQLLGLFLVAGILALFLYYILSYLVSLLAFWSREAMGPRFLFEWFLEFASGAYIPLDILRQAFFIALTWLPFFYLIYFPISIYLGRLTAPQILINFIWQISWIIVLGLLTKFTWQNGLRKYTGEGI